MLSEGSKTFLTIQRKSTREPGPVNLLKPTADFNELK